MATTTIRIDCSSLLIAEVAEVDLLARAQLDLRRQGCELRMTNPSSSLLELVGFCGLASVLRAESSRETEEGEEPFRLEEEGQLADPPI